MLFNSIDFVVFLPIVFALYWFVKYKNLKLQNLLILTASYIFYGWWDWRFLFLIFFSTIIDFTSGKAIYASENVRKKKIFLVISLLVNLGFLGFFKYYNFFLDNFISSFSFLGIPINANTLNIILPVGISFYTFQTLSYTIDIYKGKLEPAKDFISFAAFVSFFPQLVAGPIERASNLLPQFYKKRVFDYRLAVNGLRQILWGLFKKIVIADNCAEYANLIFENSSTYSGSTLFLGAVFFAFQIYGDFSGYSDIAIGTSRLFGFNLMQNFAFPYFSRDIAEFWRRWHISLSTWFRDYLYIPLGGSRGNLGKRIRNTFIIFLVSGFWHGANWTFLIWGFLNAIYFLPLLLTNNNRQNIGTVAEGKLLPSIKDTLQIILTFLLTVIAWVFFRAENLSHAFQYISGIFNFSFFRKPEVLPVQLFILLLCFILVEWKERTNQFGFEKIGVNASRPIRWAVTYILIFIILIFMQTKETPFIYFQF